MKRLLIAICCAAFVITAGAQTQARAALDENTVVKDTTGMQYPYIVWRKMLSSGEYTLKQINRANLQDGFLIIKLSEEEKQKRSERAPKPTESKFFTTGKDISNFKERDIDGTKWNLKHLKGKVVVMNFWFINCAPCRQEMPELNKVVEEYKNDSSVVFLSFCLDEKSSIQHFLASNPFNYKIVDNARYIAEQYKVSSYPTHVVLDKEGKVQYHTSGLASGTVPWLKKTIASLTKQPG